jgi:hypothetical protein
MIAVTGRKYCLSTSATSRSTAQRSASCPQWPRGISLRALDEVDTSLDVGLETLDGLIEKLLLVVVDVGKNVDGLLDTAGLLKCQ